MSFLLLTVENSTHATFDLHTLHILLLGVFKEDVGEVRSWYQALDVVGQMHHHAISQQDFHCPLGHCERGHKTRKRQERERNQSQVWTCKL